MKWMPLNWSKTPNFSVKFFKIWKQEGCRTDVVGFCSNLIFQNHVKLHFNGMWRYLLWFIHYHAIPINKAIWLSKAIKNQYHHIYQYFYSNLSSLEEYKLRKPGFTKQKMSLQTKKGMCYYQCSWLNFEWGNFLYNSGLNEGMLWNENYEAHNKLPKKNFYNSITENDTFSGV